MEMRKCDVCGEEYSSTYRSCPFCEEQEAIQRGKPIRRHTSDFRNRRGGHALGVLALVLALVVIGAGSIHFFGENQRVQRQFAALQSGDFAAFLQMVTESGRSSWMYLQDITPAGAIQHQDMAVALALCDRLLQGSGAFRVHGGGFAGTVQAFVPLEKLEQFRSGIEAVLGQGACHVLSIRAEGGVRLD